MTNATICLIRIKNILRKEKNAGHQIFSFPTMFSKAFFLIVVKNPECAVKGLLFAKQQILDTSELKHFADNNFLQKGRKHSGKRRNC